MLSGIVKKEFKLSGNSPKQCYECCIHMVLRQLKIAELADFTL